MPRRGHLSEPSISIFLRSAILDTRTIFRHFGVNDMDRLAKSKSEITHSAIIYEYPCGVVDIIHSTKGFTEAGWEAAGAKPQPQRRSRKSNDDESVADLGRSMRRARANLRRLALANDFKYFVTLTLDQTKIDRYDPKIIVKTLNSWLDNRVRRKGLKYVLVPERHKDGAIHFHGFFNDALRVIDSGRRDSGGHCIYNLPDWTLGFTTAIELYGEYGSAVGYVTKYIGKGNEKPMGRWYYSGGALAQPSKTYADLDREDLLVEYAGECVEFNVPTAKITVIHTRKE